MPCFHAIQSVTLSLYNTHLVTPFTSIKPSSQEANISTHHHPNPRYFHQIDFYVSYFMFVLPKKLINSCLRLLQLAMQLWAPFLVFHNVHKHMAPTHIMFVDLYCGWKWQRHRYSSHWIIIVFFRKPSATLLTLFPELTAPVQRVGGITRKTMMIMHCTMDCSQELFHLCIMWAEGRFRCSSKVVGSIMIQQLIHLV